MNFTKKQLLNWSSYENVRLEGQYNMFDPNARILTELSEEEYGFCMKNYSELKDAYEDK